MNLQNVCRTKASIPARFCFGDASLQELSKLGGGILLISSKEIVLHRLLHDDFDHVLLFLDCLAPRACNFGMQRIAC